MSRACLLHPENVCDPDAEGRCTCAPAGMAHDDRCATRRGHKCNCAIAGLADAGSVAAMLLLTFGAIVDDAEEGEKRHA